MHKACLGSVTHLISFRSIFKPFIFVEDVKLVPKVQSPVFGSDDPVKKIPRFQEKLDRRHELYKAHEWIQTVIASDQVKLVESMAWNQQLTIWIKTLTFSLHVDCIKHTVLFSQSEIVTIRKNCTMWSLHFLVNFCMYMEIDFAGLWLKSLKFIDVPIFLGERSKAENNHAGPRKTRLGSNGEYPYQLWSSWSFRSRRPFLWLCWHRNQVFKVKWVPILYWNHHFEFFFLQIQASIQLADLFSLHFTAETVRNKNPVLIWFILLYYHAKWIVFRMLILTHAFLACFSNQ